MDTIVRLPLDRAAKVSLVAQIHGGLREAIRSGQIAEGARLPSWRDLAAQLGVARGTVRAAYERLADEQLVVAEGSAGTRVVGRVSAPSPLLGTTPTGPFPELYSTFGTSPLPFQNGVPAEDAFPYRLWSKLLTRAARVAARSPVGYPDPRGPLELRREIASYLSVARGLACDPSQVLITAGFSGALGLSLSALQLAGRTAWLEEPGFPLTRATLRRGGLSIAAVPVDAEGLDVARGIEIAPDALLAVVTPGQHAPLGHTMSLSRRTALLDWAAEAEAWILEDDYLGELQLDGRAAPALMSLDRHGRVLHAGTFSKTLSPALRLGFLVVPPGLITRCAEAAAALAPAPTGAAPLAVRELLAGGHYLRHLRRMKRLYRERRQVLAAALRASAGEDAFRVEERGGFAVRLLMQRPIDDVAIAARANARGLAAVPLSPWYTGSRSQSGLVLGFSNLDERRLSADCAALFALARSPDGHPTS